VIVWERGEDKSAAETATFQQGRLYIQSAKTWRESFDPYVNEYAVQPQSQAVVIANAATKLRRFEYVNPAQNASKFWTIQMTSDQLSFDINFGRIGTNGRTTPIRKSFSDIGSAKRDYANRIEAQLRDGYVEV
jgi:predicted DNA-binding WGR domain protein